MDSAVGFTILQGREKDTPPQEGTERFRGGSRGAGKNPLTPAPPLLSIQNKRVAHHIF